MGSLIDRTGVRYGRLVVEGRDLTTGPASKGRRVRWRCRCECGSVTSVTGHELAAGDTTSCGCWHREQVGNRARVHGFYGSGTYRSWRAAKERCHNPKNIKYPSYGGAGITMCDKWRNSFKAFLEDMGERPAGTTINRKDLLCGYEPGNCAWATHKEQTEDRGNTKFFYWRGARLTVAEIARLENLPLASIKKRARAHSTIQEAVRQTRLHLR